MASVATYSASPSYRQRRYPPSGNALAITALIKLTGLYSEIRYVDYAYEALAQMQPMMPYVR